MISRSSPKTTWKTGRFLHKPNPWCRGNTALHWAAGSGHAAVVEKLRDAGAKVDVARKDGPGLGGFGRSGGSLERQLTAPC